MDNLPQLLIMLFCLIGSAFFSSSETAYTSFNRTKMKNKAMEGNKRAALAMKHAENYDRLLSTILVGNNIVNITLSSIATVWFVKIMNGSASAPAVSTIVITVVVLIFGEITPKVLAKDFPERVALAVARPLQLLVIILWPINCLFMLFRKLLSKIFRNKEEETVTEGELLTLVDEAHEDGTIDEYDKEIIENIFDFDDLSAGELATHRTDVTVLFEEESLEEWDTVITESRYSRYPICRGDADHIVGILDANEYFRLEEKTKESVMEKAVNPVYFVPENVKADILFKNMKESKESIAVVLDEHGGVCGIVTMTDLVERLVGEFTEKSEDEEAEIMLEAIDESTWQIGGAALLSDVSDALGIALDDSEADTFNGFVLGLYGSIPEDGTKFELSTDRLEIRVEEICDHKIEKAIVVLKQSEAKEEAIGRNEAE